MDERRKLVDISFHSFAMSLSPAIIPVENNITYARFQALLVWKKICNGLVHIDSVKVTRPCVLQKDKRWA